MMKNAMAIKITALMLSVIMLMGVLSGCGKDSEAEAQSASEADAAAEPMTYEQQLEARADEIISEMTPEQMIAQMFLVRCDATTARSVAAEYCPGGYILFGVDFKESNPESFRLKVSDWQSAAPIGMIIAVDEEGGTVVRASRYEAFRSERFKSPAQLYAEGGYALLREDALEKSKFLLDLGINMNLAPVCDISEIPGEFMYERALGCGVEETSAYVGTVVMAMEESNMMSVLKHFPGYGGNADTHTGIAIDDRPYEQFLSREFLPFGAGVAAGADCILVSHNNVLCMDADYPASLSKNAHDILRSELGFKGVVMTDDLVMDAIGKFANPADAAVMAVAAGNDMLISSDFKTQYNAVLDAYNSGTITKERIQESAKRIIIMKLKHGIIE